MSSGEWGWAVPAGDSPSNMLAGAVVFPDFTVNGFDKAYSEETDVVPANLWAGLPVLSDAIKVKVTSAAAADDRTELFVAAAVDMSIPAGTYTGAVLITAVANDPPPPPPPTFTTIGFTVADGSQGAIDMDNNMIPIRYIGDVDTPLWVIADPEVNSTAGTQDDDWFDYDARQWANAVTVVDSTLAAYRDSVVGTAVSEADILGYWVYVPRYAYEVQRRDAVDKPIASQTLFDIKFETKTAGIKMPAKTCSEVDGSGPKDYRTECDLNRTYPGQSASYDATGQDATTWATHPAFWWDKNNDQTRDSNEELNGIWVGKYETTGSLAQATIKPNLKSQISQYIGVQFATAKGMGPNYADSGGNAGIYGKNYHNFDSAADRLNVHQQKNTEWGAVAYLSTSIYGVGSANFIVMNNTSYTSMDDGNGNSSAFGITGCGPNTATSNLTYNDATITGTSPNQVATSCSSGNPQRNYYGTLGQLASTTQNVYGVYDMAGGAREYVMGNITTLTTEATSNTTYMATSPNLNYLNLYGASITLPNILGTGSLAHSFGTTPSWSSSSSGNYYNWDVCTWETCGGQALSETIAVQSVSGANQSWSSDYSYFVILSHPWFERGGSSEHSSGAGVFATIGYNGDVYTYISFRASLVGF